MAQKGGILTWASIQRVSPTGCAWTHRAPRPRAPKWSLSCSVCKTNLPCRSGAWATARWHIRGPGPVFSSRETQFSVRTQNVMGWCFAVTAHRGGRCRLLHRVRQELLTAAPRGATAVQRAGGEALGPGGLVRSHQEPLLDKAGGAATRRWQGLSLDIRWGLPGGPHHGHTRLPGLPWTGLPGWRDRRSGPLCIYKERPPSGTWGSESSPVNPHQGPEPPSERRTHRHLLSRLAPCTDAFQNSIKPPKHQALES